MNQEGIQGIEKALQDKSIGYIKIGPDKNDKTVYISKANINIIKIDKIGDEIMGIKEKKKQKIKNILNDYYTEILKEQLKDKLILKYGLSLRFRDSDDRVFLEMKPYKYKNYTYITDWNKDNSFLMLLHITENMITINDKIKYLYKEDKWE